MVAGGDTTILLEELLVFLQVLTTLAFVAPDKVLEEEDECLIFEPSQKAVELVVERLVVVWIVLIDVKWVGLGWIDHTHGRVIWILNTYIRDVYSRLDS